MYQNVWFRGWRCCNFTAAIKASMRHAQTMVGRWRKFPLLKPGLSPTETLGFPYWKSEPHDGKKSPESLVVDDTWHIWHIISKTLRVPLRKHVRITILLKNASYLSLCHINGKVKEPLNWRWSLTASYFWRKIWPFECFSLSLQVESRLHKPRNTLLSKQNN